MKTKRKPTALRHLPRSKRAKAQHVQREVLRSQAAGQSEKPGNARQTTAVTYTSRLPESGLGARKRAAMAKEHHNLRADRQATTDHSTARPRKGHDQMRSPTRRASRKWTAIEEPRTQTHEAHQIIPAAPPGQVAQRVRHRIATPREVLLEQYCSLRS